MRKLRKGSIAWDKQYKEKVKLLTSPDKGELPDGLAIACGKKYHPIMVGHILVSQEYRNPYGIRYNNKPCRISRIGNLIPIEEYLKIT